MQLSSPGNLGQHQKFCLKEPHEVDLIFSNSPSIVPRPENLLAPSPESSAGGDDHRTCEARRKHLTSSIILDDPELEDHKSPEEMMTKSLKRKGGSTSPILSVDTNVVNDSPEDMRDPHEPVLQVKATPYVNGHLLKSASIDRNPRLSPLGDKNSLLNDRALALSNKSNGMSPSPTIIETSSAQISSSKPTEDVLSEFNSSDMFRSIDISADSGSGHLRVREMAEYQKSDIASGSQNDTTHVEDTFISATALPEKSDVNHMNKTHPITAQDGTQKTKRKFLELRSPSLETVKRHKQVDSSTFDFSGDPQTMADPSILGDKHRQDFFNSRKNIIDSHANEAMKSSTVVPQSLKPGLYGKSIANEGQPGGNLEINAPPYLISRTQTSFPNSEISDIEEATSASGDEEQLEEIHKSAKTDWSLNVASEVAEDQITDRVRLQDTGSNLLTTRVDCHIKHKTVFDQFKATYPDYTATSQQFVAICRKLERLVRDGHMVHQYLWDDFIIRHKTEYPTYLSTCADKAEDPLPYEQFYYKNVVKPLFTNGVVNPENIDQVLLARQQVGNPDDQRNEQQRKNILDVENNVRKEVVKKSTSPPKAPDSDPKPTRPEVMVDVTIDLTSDEKISKSAHRQNLMDFSRRSPRTLPWVTNTSRDEDTPAKHAVARVASSNHVCHSSLRSAPLSSLQRSKTSYRVSPSPKKVAHGNDKESDISTRAEKMISDQSTSIEDLTNITEAQKPDIVFSSSSRFNQDFRLRSPLAPEQREGSRVNHTSTPQDDKFLTKPVIYPHESRRSKAPNETQKEARGRVENTPFATFAKAYAAIRNGNGNSYARDKEKNDNDDGIMQGKCRERSRAEAN